MGECDEGAVEGRAGSDLEAVPSAAGSRREPSAICWWALLLWSLLLLWLGGAEEPGGKAMPMFLRR